MKNQIENTQTITRKNNLVHTQQIKREMELYLDSVYALSDLIVEGSHGIIFRMAEAKKKSAWERLKQFFFEIGQEVPQNLK
jgi:hypothetical protein